LIPDESKGSALDLEVTCQNGRWLALWGDRRRPCVIGRGGVRQHKAEGDGATPVGRWPIRRVLYRADRLEPPRTAQPCDPLRPEDGWCDAPGDPRYNTMVGLPYPASHERLWRDDEIYDCLVVLGYNDDPVRAGAGSAIFLHVARPDMSPTDGCVALSRADLLEYLSAAALGSGVCVAAP
jgi:L,D-peptidoglycan transpeptidase YkuD (ErfK/YbiS/YcfS/YnhG family)